MGDEYKGAERTELSSKSVSWRGVGGQAVLPAQQEGHLPRLTQLLTLPPIFENPTTVVGVQGSPEEGSEGHEVELPPTLGLRSGQVPPLGH